MTPKERATAETVLEGYDSWASDREILSAREDDPEDSVSASQWEASDTAGVEYAHSLADLLRKAVESPPTYHGILMAQCLECGHLSTDKTELEYWNDYGVPCIRETDRRSGRTRWWTSDGRVTVTDTDDEGTTWQEEVKAPKPGEIPQ